MPVACAAAAPALEVLLGLGAVPFAGIGPADSVGAAPEEEKDGGGDDEAGVLEPCEDWEEGEEVGGVVVVAELGGLVVAREEEEDEEGGVTDVDILVVVVELPTPVLKLNGFISAPILAGFPGLGSLGPAAFWIILACAA